MLTAERISKTFGDQRALDDVTLSIQPGEVHALLGENGSGKSTLIRVLAGYHLPDPGGIVRVRGGILPLGSPSASFEHGLRFVHQKLGLLPELNAIENIALEAGYTRPAFINWREQEQVTRDLLDRLKVEMDVWRPLRDCRPVERSAVAIARALRTSRAGDAVDNDEAAVVVLDEPTSSLPMAEVRQLFQVVQDLCSNGISVIYVTHRLDEVFEISDRVTVLRDGKRVDTVDTADLTRESVVEMIVGRQLASRWQAPIRDEASDSGASLALEIDGLVAGRIRGLSLSVRAGEIVGVAGVTGSGRDELARVLVGATLPEDGVIRVGGELVNPVTPRNTQRVGLVLALGNTQPHSATGSFTVGENLTLTALHRYFRFGWWRSRAENSDTERWMDRLDIRPRDQRRPYKLLSGGNQQKVILGKWLSATPKVLVLDEPTAGVDIGARRALGELIVKAAEAGLAVLVCSSDGEDIVSLCGRAVVMRNGRVLTELMGDSLTEHNLLLLGVGGTVNATTEGAAPDARRCDPKDVGDPWRRG